MLKHPIIKIALLFLIFFACLVLAAFSLLGGFNVHSTLGKAFIFAVYVTSGFAAFGSLAWLAMSVWDYLESKEKSNA